MGYLTATPQLQNATTDQVAIACNCRLGCISYWPAAHSYSSQDESQFDVRRINNALATSHMYTDFTIVRCKFSETLFVTLTLKSNQLIFVSICTKDVNLAKFPQAAYGIVR